MLKDLRPCTTDFESGAIPLENESARPLLEAFPAGVVICDKDGTIAQANTILLNLFGYDEAELIGKSIDILLPEAHRTNHHSNMSGYMRNPEKREMGLGRELHARRKDGTIFPVEIGLNPVRGESGMHVLATVADVTNRRRLENSFRAIVDAAPVGMLIVDHSGNIQHVNSHLTRIFGYQMDELLGQKMEILLPERIRYAHPALRESFTQQPVSRAMGLNRDLTGLHKSGIEIPLEIGLNPMESVEGRVIIATVIDISDRKRDEIRLKQLNADLDEFTYVASHDLRSPLRGISNLVDWISEDLGEGASDDVRNNLDRIQARIERMDKLVEDLLAYARSGRQTNEVHSVSLKLLIDEVSRFVDPPEGFKIEASGDLDIIKTNGTPLETTLRNLLSNAIKHHDRASGLIRVIVTAEGNSYRFEVIDDGPGIPPTAHDRIFKLFQTLSNSEGTRSGVGLAVCKRLVESHGGRIEVESAQDNRGTCFRFWWPRFLRSDINDHRKL